MSEMRDRAQSLLDAASGDRATGIGIAASAAWLLLVLLFAWLGLDGGNGGAGWLVALSGTLMPLALIWLAVGLARSIASLRAEADDLRAELARLQSDHARIEAKAVAALDAASHVLPPYPHTPYRQQEGFARLNPPLV